MYHYILGITFIKSLTPYFRKYMLTELEGHELLFVNTFLISLVVLIMFLYRCAFDKTIYATIEKYKKLSIWHYVCLFFIGVFAIVSSSFLFHFDKHYNNPLMNSMFLRGGSILSMFFVGVFLFEEKYNWTQIAGLIITIIGIFLLAQKDDI